MNAVLPKISKPIALVGMMGAGKSHIGYMLAEALGLEFYDSDKIIEEKAGMTIPEIFQEFGEPKFRNSEHNTILELVNDGSCVISTGGGALTSPETLKVLLDQSLMVWLNASIGTLWERVKDTDRPLLQTPNARETLENLLNERKPLYEQAHIQVKSDQDSKHTVQSILKALES